MKIRNGFISNSSSTSFIISKDNFSTIWDVALAMIPCRTYGEKGEPFEDNDELMEIARWNKEKGNVWTKNLTFPTCNFDTFIHDAGDVWWISTCNNHIGFYKIFAERLYPQEDITRCEEFRGKTYKETWSIKDYIEFFLKEDFHFLELEKL